MNAAPDEFDDTDPEAPPIAAAEPDDYSDEPPIVDNRYADRAAADWWAWRSGR